MPRLRCLLEAALCLVVTPGVVGDAAVQQLRNRELRRPRGPHPVD
jgi:hypothetical protein